jgi:hypothetical protein
VVTCADRFWWLDVLRRCDVNGTTGEFFGLTVLSLMILNILLVIGGIEQNVGLLWKVRTRYVTYVMVAAEIRIQESNMNYVNGGINICDRVKAQATERKNWNCEMCRDGNV